MHEMHKIQIARDFIEMHAEADVGEWSHGYDRLSVSDNYLRIFVSLEMGDYGYVTDNAEYDDFGVITRAATTFEIGIHRFDSKSGNPEIFSWES